MRKKPEFELIIGILNLNFNFGKVISIILTLIFLKKLYLILSCNLIQTLDGL